jgi:hypothetical protein
MIKLSKDNKKGFKKSKIAEALSNNNENSLYLDELTIAYAEMDTPTRQFMFFLSKLMAEPEKYCVQCGYCCTVAPCKHGKWNEEKTRCKFLNDNNLCQIYEKIKNDEEIGFGKGCSSSLFNEWRDKKIKKE